MSSAVGTEAGEAGEAAGTLRDAPLDVEYVGRWDSADDRYLVVTDPPDGGMVLAFFIGDAEQRFAGSVTAEGLRFMRNGRAEAAILLPGSNGGEHGCISISDGETYCRS